MIRIILVKFNFKFNLILFKFINKYENNNIIIDIKITLIIIDNIEFK